MNIFGCSATALKQEGRKVVSSLLCILAICLVFVVSWQGFAAVDCLSHGGTVKIDALSIECNKA